VRDECARQRCRKMSKTLVGVVAVVVEGKPYSVLVLCVGQGRFQPWSGIQSAGRDEVAAMGAWCQMLVVPGAVWSTDTSTVLVFILSTFRRRRWKCCA